MNDGNHAPGVLRDDVIRDPRSTGELIILTLADQVDAPAAETFVRGIFGAIDDVSGTGEDKGATACVGFGSRLFDRLATRPAGLHDLTAGAGELLDADLVIYTMTREEWRAADLRRRIAELGAGIITAAVTDRGYQRPDGRELGGFRDGLRNAQADRERHVFVDRDESPEEPAAAAGGTYMATMHIVQDLAAWNALAVDDQQQVIGRRKSDGSRLDLAEGAPVPEETELGDGIPASSHIAKAGPRGDARDRLAIFRRGLPFVELLSNGTIEAGLLFVSFQATMEQFLTVRDEWMNNPDFPAAGTTTDQLFARGFANMTRTAFFFVPAEHKSEFPGYEFFHPIEDDDRCLGRIAVRKKIVDSNGAGVHAELGGFTFQLLDQTGTAQGEPFTTDSAGRAVSPPVPVGETYTLHETATRDGFQPTPDIPVTLDKRRIAVPVTNTLQPTNPNPGYR